MKVVSSRQMAEIESVAYQGGASEEVFMQEAGSGVALVAHDFVERYNLDRYILLLCGKGNNAGDAYVAGMDLMLLEYDVIAIQMSPLEECSPLCRQQHLKFMEEGGKSIVFPFHETLHFPKSGIIIDGLFGTGFRGQVHEPYAHLIRVANESKLPIISVDIPSGLNGEDGVVDGHAIIATETAFLGLPKTGFFLNQGWDHVGKLRYVDFGLPQESIDTCRTDLLMLTPEIVQPYLPLLKNGRHKYQAGSVAALAGSPGMAGAAILSSLAALRSGAGIVKTLYPHEMQVEFASMPFEMIKVAYDYENVQPVIDLINKSSAALIGPALGTGEASLHVLEQVLQAIKCPCVIDADALTLIAKHRLLIPKGAVLTPHHGEMARLLQIESLPKIDVEVIERCRRYATEHEVTLVLKGGPTFIFHGDESILVNPTGNPGMATAGSGDVLTGMIAGLMAQGVTPHHAACLGVYMHGVAGDHAAANWTPYAMTASDIIYHFPEAFQFILL